MPFLQKICESTGSKTQGTDKPRDNKWLRIVEFFVNQDALPCRGDGDQAASQADDAKTAVDRPAGSDDRRLLRSCVPVSVCSIRYPGMGRRAL